MPFGLALNKPSTLSDLRLTCLPENEGVSALTAAWMMAPCQHLQSARTLTEAERLDDISILEPDPNNHKNHQSSYIHLILAAHRMTDANPVKTQQKPGVCLSKRDCPATPNPELHR